MKILNVIEALLNCFYLVAMTNASVVPLLKPNASSMAITIGVRINAAPSLANSAATAAPSKTI